MEKFDPFKYTRGTDINGGLDKPGILVDENLPACEVNQINTNFHAFVTFYIHNGSPKNITEYARQIFQNKNRGSGFVPVTHSFDLIKALKRIEHPYGGPYTKKNGKADLNLKRLGIKDEILYKHSSDIGLFDLYSRSGIQNSTVDALIKREIDAITARGIQFSFFVPQENPTNLNIIGSGTTDEEYPVFRFSKKYLENKIAENLGFRATPYDRGEIIEITRDELKDSYDQIVIGFGKYMGPKEDEDGDLNSKRKFLMKITPYPILPRL